MIEVANVVKRYGQAAVPNAATFPISEAQLTRVAEYLERRWKPQTRSWGLGQL